MSHIEIRKIGVKNVTRHLDIDNNEMIEVEVHLSAISSHGVDSLLSAQLALYDTNGMSLADLERSALSKLSDVLSAAAKITADQLEVQFRSQFSTDS